MPRALRVDVGAMVVHHEGVLPVPVEVAGNHDGCMCFDGAVNHFQRACERSVAVADEDVQGRLREPIGRREVRVVIDRWTSCPGFSTRRATHTSAGPFPGIRPWKLPSAS